MGYSRIPRVVFQEQEGINFVTTLSVVVPAFNESDNLRILIPSIVEEIRKLDILEYEILVINDGSSDDTVLTLEQQSNVFPNLKAINLHSNKGQAHALFVGIQESKFEFIITMDADYQNDPKDFKNLIQSLVLSTDCICGWRKDRKDKLVSRKIVSYIANKFIAKISKLDIHDFGCTLRIYRSEAIKKIPIYGEIHRFIPAYLKLYGFKISEIPVSHNKRKFGKSNYGLSRIHRVLLDMIVLYVHFNYREKPMHLFGSIGLISFISGLAIFLISFLLKILQVKDFVETPLLLLGSLFFLSGVFVLLLGVIAELELFRNKRNFYK
jgi:glycosyltransferase involved in cell wall biosynthesis